MMILMCKDDIQSIFTYSEYSILIITIIIIMET